MNVMYKFTGQKVVVTTSKPFDAVIASIDEAVQRAPGKERWAEARKFRDNSKHVDAVLAKATGPSGFILLEELTWGYDKEWNNKGPARRRVMYVLGTSSMAKAIWTLGTSARVTPFRVSIVEGRMGQSAEVHYDLLSSLVSGSSDGERSREAVGLDRHMATMVENIVGATRRKP